MRLEHVERRVLGAVRFLDATTTLPIRAPLAVVAERVRFVCNRGGRYVIFSAPGLQAYTESFQRQPVAPDPQSVALRSIPIELNITDPEGVYLPRRSTIEIPLDADPARADDEGSLFKFIDVKLYPSPVAQTSVGWAVVRATVKETGTNNRLPWALIRVLRAGDSLLLATGLSDRRGEALVPVSGIPITTWEEGTGPVLATEIDVALEVVFDPAVKKVRDPEDLSAADDPNRGYVPDPNDLEARRATLPSSSSPAKLASGREHKAVLEVTLP